MFAKERKTERMGGGEGRKHTMKRQKDIKSYTTLTSLAWPRTQHNKDHTHTWCGVYTYKTIAQKKREPFRGHKNPICHKS